MNREKKSSEIIVPYLLIVIVPFIILLLISSVVLKNPLIKTVESTTDLLILSSNHQAAEKELFLKASAHPDNVEIQREYIENHFAIPEKSRHSRRDDTPIRRFYEGLSAQSHPGLADIGTYCLGLVYSHLNQEDQALSLYLRVKNKNFPYVNNSIAWQYIRLGDTAQAEQFALNEIELRGNLSGAVSNLCDIYFNTREDSKLFALLNREDLKTHMPQVYQKYDLFHRDFGKYLRTAVYHNNFASVTLLSLTAALLSFLVWLIFILRLDAYEPEKILLIAGILLLSSLLTVFCIVIYDLFHFTFRFSLNGDLLNDMLYCIAGIGLIKETVKIIPVLVILFATREMNESSDYFVYPSLSGLAFSLIENIGKFDISGLANVSGRSFSSVIFHIILATIAWHGFYRLKYFKQSPIQSALWIAGSFAAAVILHGLYDFFLINDQASSFSIVSWGILVFSLLIYQRIVNAYIRASEFLNAEKNSFISGAANYLLYGLSLIVVLQYCINVIQFGSGIAGLSLLKNLLSYISAIYILYLTFRALSPGEVRISDPRTTP
jgi:RsiW-degrading membrane proteinase PrsW (M82 family)